MTERDRRALGIGVAVLLAALAFRALPMGAAALRRLRSDIDQRGALAQRMRSDIRQVNALVDSGTLVRRRFLALAPQILTGGTATEAITDLTSRLTMLVAHEATIDRADAVPDPARVGWLRRVTVHIAFQSDLAGTLSALAAATRGPAVLTLHDVRLVAVDPASPDGAPEIILAEASISGWFLARTADR